MKELTGSAAGTTQASRDQTMLLLEDIDRYPSWYPEVVKEAEVLERDGQGRPTKAHTVLHVERGPLTKDFNLVMTVNVDPSAGTIALRRIPHGPDDPEQFDVTWSVDESNSTRIRLELAANLSVPRLIPLGGVGDSLAQGLVSAATRALQS
ncbi:MAG TPA: SRPBCC family protein [Solirubrobacteraceae bacterium]|nr:SRPBCC family protein [Solirubrobacteraceae bacterium]